MGWATKWVNWGVPLRLCKLLLLWVWANMLCGSLQLSNSGAEVTEEDKYSWLVVWNHGILWLSIYREFHHPNWRTPSFFSGVGLNHQPDKEGYCGLVQWPEGHHEWAPMHFLKVVTCCNCWSRCVVQSWKFSWMLFDSHQIPMFIRVCLKMGYTPNYSHLVGIMIIKPRKMVI